MTTKQEIIDLAEAILEGGTDNGVREILVMLHKLKPEIKVGKLVWESINIQVIDKANPLHHQYRTEYYNNQGYGYIKPFNKGYLVVGIEGKEAAFETLNESTDYVQKLWDEYVLSLVEVENVCK